TRMKRHDATQLGFDKRPGGEPGAVWTIGPGQSIPTPSVKNASSLRLRYKGEAVLVNKHRQQSGNQFAGEIYGFEPSIGVQFAGMKIGDEITFEDSHIFTVN